jgi:hypothetical protein
VAIQCHYCGTDLPKDDARFCNNCGMLVPSHPFSPQSLSAAKIDASQSSAPPQMQGEGKPVLREQIANLSPAPPPRLPTRSGPSSWHGQYKLFEQGEQEKKGPSDTVVDELQGKLQGKLPETPKPATHEDEAEESMQPEGPLTFMQPRPISDIARPRDGAHGRTAKQVQEPPRPPMWPTPMTHVSVNEPVEEDGVSAQKMPFAVNARPAELEPVDKNVQDVEDVPTRTIESVPAERADAKEQSVELLPTSPLELSAIERAQEHPVEKSPISPLPRQPHAQADASPYDDIEYQSTTPLSTPGKATWQPTNMEAPVQDAGTGNRPPSIPGGAPSRPGNTEVPNQDAYIINRQSGAASNVPALRAPVPVQRVPSPPTPFLGWEPGGANAPAPRMPAPVQRVPSPPTPFLGLGEAAARENVGQVPAGSRTRGRVPTLVVGLLLIVLIIGGIGAWIAVYQPFNIAPITRPQLSFSNTRLGIALSYPNGWTQQVVSGAAHFYASNHTAEVDIAVANAGDVNQALQQQATKLGLSGTKAGTALTFAGTTWQQSQGNLQQSGANYTVTLLAAVHGSHLYTIVQQAPQSNYADWEKAFFSPLRGSLQFL